MYKLYINNKSQIYVGISLVIGDNKYPYKGVWNYSVQYNVGDSVSFSLNGSEVRYYYVNSQIYPGYMPSQVAEWTLAPTSSYINDGYDYFDNWRLADLGDDKPAMNYQANNIAELKDRQANYSQALKLPPTKNNCLIFGYSDSFDVVTQIPYKKFDCRLFSNESVLAGQGSILIIDKITTHFEIRILSGNVDLFELLTNKPMSDLDLGTYILGSKTVLDNYSNSNYCIPVATFLVGGTGSINTSVNHAYPFAWLKNAIEKIFSSNGYTLQTNLLDTDWNNKAINVCSLNPNPDSVISFDAHAGGNSTSLRTTGEYIQFNINPSGNGKLITFDESGIKGMRWVAPVDCSIDVVFGVSTPTPLAGSDLKIKKNLDIICELYDSMNGTISQTINLSEGDILDITALKRPNSTNSATSTYAFFLSEMQVETVPPLGKLYIAPNLGFETQFDLLKAFVQLYGLTLLVDNETKVVKAYTMQKLYDNKVNAKDWSNKLHDVPGDKYFAFGSYAQKNIIKFDENTADNTTDSGSFAVANETLEKTKELFSIKFESGLDRSLNNCTIANIPIEEIDSSDIISFKGGKPHIVVIASSSITINGTAYTLNIATHVKILYFLDGFYTGLIALLTNAKYIEDYFFLTDEDIEEFESSTDEVTGMFIPVYVAKYGAYFYVNKIKNFVSGVLTKCELIRL